MDAERKEAIAARFVERPALFMLVRALLFGWWFRLFFVLGLLAPLGFVGMVAKLWRVTPPGFQPAVRISGLDYAQAWSLRRAALRHFAEGKTGEGVVAWRSALANHPADLDSLRGFLRHVTTQVEPPQFQREVLPQARWLLRLSATNQADLEIAGEVFLRYGYSPYLLGLLLPRRGQLSDGLSRLYLKALFDEDRDEDFAHHWRTHPRQEDLLKDGELALYWTAYLAGWGDPDQSAPARARLEAALDDPAQQVLAHRLALKVFAAREEVRRYLATLERLEAWRRDSVRDHIQGWLLLAAQQRKEEARRRAQSFASRPMTAYETLLLVQAYYDLGLRELALEALDRFTLEYGFAEELWVTYANHLVEARRWDQLQQLALKIRTHDQVGLSLRALSFYLEGRAELGQGHREAGEAAFQRIAGVRVENFGLAFALATNLRRLGFPALARDLLQSHQEIGESVCDFWRLLTRVAYDLKDPELLLQAAEKTFRLTPNNGEAMNNYAAALLLNRQRPAEAIRFASEVLRKSPARAGSHLNYAAALLQNHRYQEAARELDLLSKATLDDTQQTSFLSLRCELLVRLGRLDEARRVLTQIDRARLFPNEAGFLARLVEEKPAA
jgi:predicted Zn-dependent protease